MGFVVIIGLAVIIASAFTLFAFKSADGGFTAKFFIALVALSLFLVGLFIAFAVVSFYWDRI